MARKKKYPVKDKASEAANAIISQIQNGTAPWMKPWKAGEVLEGPINASTGNAYRGFNRIWLASQQPTDDPRWCTYNQAQSMGAQVRKGATGTPIQVFISSRDVAVKDDNGKPVKNAEGKTLTQKEQLDRPFVKWFTVFHASQIDGLEPYNSPKSKMSDFERHERCEAILAESGAQIRHESGNRAFYQPATDTITLPLKEQFHAPDGYYATALHELGHWTGHESRLDRDLAHGFGTEGYAKEELRAEIASYMLGQELAIGHDPGQHAAYAESWLKALKNDPSEIFRAAKDAEKITNHVMQFDLSKTHDQTIKEDSKKPEKTSLSEQFETLKEQAIINNIEHSAATEYDSPNM